MGIKISTSVTVDEEILNFYIDMAKRTDSQPDVLMSNVLTSKVEDIKRRAEELLKLDY